MLANLLLADLESVEKKKTKVAKLAQAGIKEAKAELPVLNKVFDTLQEGIPARTLDLSEDDLAVIRELNLITLKPVLYVLNISEDDIADPMRKPRRKALSGFLFRLRSKKKFQNSIRKKPRCSWPIWAKMNQVSTT